MKGTPESKDSGVLHCYANFGLWTAGVLPVFTHKSPEALAPYEGSACCAPKSACQRILARLLELGMAVREGKVDTLEMPRILLIGRARRIPGIEEGAVEVAEELTIEEDCLIRRPGHACHRTG